VVRFDPEKVIAVVESQYPDNGNELKDPGPTEIRIAEHIIEFLEREVQYGRMPANLLPLQSGGVSIVAWIAVTGLPGGAWPGMPFYPCHQYMRVLCIARVRSPCRMVA
jgi:acyl-CoA hydrolase